jgi:hypothetical protein
VFLRERRGYEYLAAAAVFRSLRLMYPSVLRVSKAVLKSSSCVSLRILPKSAELPR